jgi:succinate dehydrogenase/fumarate reductase flavoprotein subunit
MDSSTRGPAREEADVVVIGGGGAGLAAAIEAATLGRKVVLLEKNIRLGGSTAWSVGSITASLTPHQIEAGILDCPRDHDEDIPGFAGRWEGRDNDELRRLLTENVPETFRWLLSMGLVFFGPMPEPPHRRPRMHTVLPNSRAYIYQLSRRARRLGVDIRLESHAIGLVTRDGAVCGVKYERTGRGESVLDARGGVVLASGDYSASPELKAKFISPAVAKVEPVNPMSTGDGHRMAMALGARVLNGEVRLGPEIRFLPPPLLGFMRALPPSRALALVMKWSIEHLPQRLLRPFILAVVTTALAPSRTLFAEGAILVNRNGKRFTDECGEPALAVAEQPDKIAFILFDKAVAEKFSRWPHYVSTAPGVAYAYLEDYRRNRQDVFHQAPTIAALARQLGMDERVLGETVAAHSANDNSGRPRMEHSPFYALGPVKGYVVITDGGLAIDRTMAVLDGSGKPIEGLFAAGSAGQGGLLLEGHGHHLGWAFTSGRIAGRNAACRALTPPAVAGFTPGFTAVSATEPQRVVG